LARPSCLGYEYIIDADSDNSHWFLRQARDFNKFIPHIKYKNDYLSQDDFANAKKLNTSLCRFTEGTIWRASRSLSWALITESWDHRYLQLWIALETLYGSSDPKEITYRLSQRLSFFLSKQRKEAKKLFSVAKTGYKWRSKLVHGRDMKMLKPDNAYQIIYDAEKLVGNSIKKILSDDQLIHTFNGNKRESFLDNLVFS
jgi:hypothetical protein